MTTTLPSGAADSSEKWRDDIKAQVLAAKRPEVDHRWDKSLLDLMVSCWDQNPFARPSARQIYMRLLSYDELERLFEIKGEEESGEKVVVVVVVVMMVVVMDHHLLHL